MEHYLEIERERFEERLRVSVDVPHALRDLASRRWCCSRWSRTPSSTASRRARAAARCEVTARIDRAADAAAPRRPQHRRAAARGERPRSPATTSGSTTSRRRLAGHYGERRALTLTTDAQRQHGRRTGACPLTEAPEPARTLKHAEAVAGRPGRRRAAGAPVPGQPAEVVSRRRGRRRGRQRQGSARPDRNRTARPGAARPADAGAGRARRGAAAQGRRDALDCLRHRLRRVRRPGLRAERRRLPAEAGRARAAGHDARSRAHAVPPMRRPNARSGLTAASAALEAPRGGSSSSAFRSAARTRRCSCRCARSRRSSPRASCCT